MLVQAIRIIILIVLVSEAIRVINRSQLVSSFDRMRTVTFMALASFGVLIAMLILLGRG